MNRNVFFVVLLALLGCDRQARESSTTSEPPPPTPAAQSRPARFSADRAKALLAALDPAVKLVPDPDLLALMPGSQRPASLCSLYYADVSTLNWQVTINLGSRESTAEPFTHVFVSISALRPVDALVRKEIDGLVAKYIEGFLVKAFPNGAEIRDRIVRPLGSRAAGKTADMDTDAHWIEYLVSEGDGKSQYLTCLLRITEHAFQEELNRAMQDRIQR